jgi:hypothetical protein
MGITTVKLAAAGHVVQWGGGGGGGERDILRCTLCTIRVLKPSHEDGFCATESQATGTAEPLELRYEQMSTENKIVRHISSKLWTGMGKTKETCTSHVDHGGSDRALQRRG